MEYHPVGYEHDQVHMRGTRDPTLVWHPRAEYDQSPNTSNGLVVNVDRV